MIQIVEWVNNSEVRDEQAQNNETEEQSNLNQNEELPSLDEQRNNLNKLEHRHENELGGNSAADDDQKLVSIK